MPMGPYKDFDACVLAQKDKGVSAEGAAKICGAIKAKIEGNSEELCQKFSEDTKTSPQLAKKIIDALTARGLDIEMLGRVVWEIQEAIQEQAVMEKLNKSGEAEINAAIDEVITDCIQNCMPYTECLSEITLSEGFSEDKQYELITTAKQTDSRYGDFEYSKEELETMAKHFNEDVVGTEIPVDLNHDPEHIALAWIKPGSMVVKESTRLPGQYSLYAQLYKFTPDGKQKVETGALRYFSLQIQHQFAKIVDNSKKVYKLVIRALALTNMPVIKDMAPTLSEKPHLFSNHSQQMEKEQLEVKLAEQEVTLSAKDQEIKSLNEKLALVETAKRDAELSAKVEGLCLSETSTIGFKGGEKETVLAFVKTLSEEQATAYFDIHKNIIAEVKLGEEGGAEDPANAEAPGSSNEDPNVEAESKAVELSQKEGIGFKAAYDRVLSENPKLAKRVEESVGY